MKDSFGNRPVEYWVNDSGKATGGGSHPPTSRPAHHPDGSAHPAPGGPRARRPGPTEAPSAAPTGGAPPKDDTRATSAMRRVGGHRSGGFGPNGGRLAKFPSVEKGIEAYFRLMDAGYRKFIDTKDWQPDQQVRPSLRRQ